MKLILTCYRELLVTHGIKIFRVFSFVQMLILKLFLDRYLFNFLQNYTRPTELFSVPFISVIIRTGAWKINDVTEFDISCRSNMTHTNYLLTCFLTYLLNYLLNYLLSFLLTYLLTYLLSYLLT